MKKNKVVLADRLRVCYLVAILLTGAAGLSAKRLMFAWIEIFLMGAFLFVEYSMNRCPHCGRYLDRNRGQFCQHCAQRIREDKTDT